MNAETLFKLQDASKLNNRDRAIMETLYATGVRVSELINIAIENIDFENLEIFIRNGKGGASRYVLFSYECGVRLEKYISDRKTGILFLNAHNRQFTRQGIHFVIKQYVRQTGVNSKISSHVFRHTLGFLAEKEVPFEDIAELFGHVGVESVRGYAGLKLSTRKKMYDEFSNN